MFDLFILGVIADCHIEGGHHEDHDLEHHVIQVDDVCEVGTAMDLELLVLVPRHVDQYKYHHEEEDDHSDLGLHRVSIIVNQECVDQ